MLVTVFRSRRHLLFKSLLPMCICLAMFLTVCVLACAGEGSIAILSPEEVPLELIPGVPDTSTILTVQNDSDKQVEIEFCMLLGPNRPCESQLGGDGAYAVTVEAVSFGEVAETQDASAEEPLPTPTPTVITTPLTLDPGAFRQYQLQFTAVAEQGEFPEQGLSGYLVARTKDEKDAISASIPLTIALEMSEPSVLSTARESLFGLVTIEIVVLLALIASALASLVTAGLCLHEEGISARLNPLLYLRMGIASWTKDKSWASSLVAVIAVFGAVSAIVPDKSPVLGKTVYSILNLFFPFIIAVAALLYNFTARPGPEDATADENNEEGVMLVWLVTALLLTGWALLGQLGMHILVLEAIRVDADVVVSNWIISVFQLLLLVLFALVTIFYLPSRAWAALKAQNLDEQARLITPRNAYLKAFRGIDAAVTDSKKGLDDVADLPKLKEKLPDELVGKVEALQADLRGLGLEPKDHVDARKSGNEVVSQLHQLFSHNLKELLNELIKEAAKFDPKEVEKAKKILDKANQVLDEIVDDAEEAQELVRRRKPAEVVAAAFYTSLGAPCSLRTKVYTTAWEEMVTCIGTASAQVTAMGLELDTIFDVDQHLFPNLATVLKDMDDALGSIGDDPFYLGMEELFSEFRAKLMPVAIPSALVELLRDLEDDATRQFLDALKDCPPDDQEGAKTVVKRTMPARYDISKEGQVAESKAGQKRAEKLFKDIKDTKDLKAEKPVGAILLSRYDKDRWQRKRGVDYLMELESKAAPPTTTKRVALL